MVRPAEFGEGEGEERGVTAKGMRRLLTSGWLRPESKGRYWVAVSLVQTPDRVLRAPMRCPAEAETLRRVLHVRMAKELLGGKQTLDHGPWTLDPRPWTLDPGPWTLDPGPNTLDPTLYPVDTIDPKTIDPTDPPWLGP
eukprot:1925852-Rhodomonas_salina.1